MPDVVEALLGSGVPRGLLAGAASTRKLASLTERMEAMAVKEMHKLNQTMRVVDEGLKELYKGFHEPDFNMPPQLGGNSLEVINRTVIVVFASVTGVTLLAACVDLFCRCRALDGRPKAWAVAMITCSYVLLIPGLCSTLLSLAMIVNVVGHRINVHPNSGQPSCTESTPGLAKLMWETGSYSGAVCIVVFAMVIPALELLFLIFGEVYRFGDRELCKRSGRAIILWVQHRSKWASPDVFAHVLLVYLVRSLNHPDLILTDARLDIGFTCFCAFCVGATVSALGFPLPKLAEEEDDDEEEVGEADEDRGRGGRGRVAAAAAALEDDAEDSMASEPLVAEDLRPPWVVLCCRREGLAIAMLVFGAAFAALLVHGLQAPVMSLRINDKPLYKPQGPLPLEAKPAVEALEVTEMLASDVSLWDLIPAHIDWIRGGEANSVVSLAMYAVFVLGFTIIDMIVLVLTALKLAMRPSGGVGTPQPCRLMALSRLCKKLAMLDVQVVGVYVVTLCMGVYAKIGVMVFVRYGLLILFLAELLHNVAYYAVSSAVDYYDAKEAADYALQRFAEEDDMADVPHGGASVGCCTAAKSYIWPFGERRRRGGGSGAAAAATRSHARKPLRAEQLMAATAPMGAVEGSIFGGNSWQRWAT